MKGTSPFGSLPKFEYLRSIFLPCLQHMAIFITKNCFIYDEGFSIFHWQLSIFYVLLLYFMYYPGPVRLSLRKTNLDHVHRQICLMNHQQTHQTSSLTSWDPLYAPLYPLDPLYCLTKHQKHWVMRPGLETVFETISRPKCHTTCDKTGLETIVETKMVSKPVWSPKCHTLIRRPMKCCLDAPLDPLGSPRVPPRCAHRPSDQRDKLVAYTFAQFTFGLVWSVL